MVRKTSWEGNKSDLPEKICDACGCTFTWREKWASDWSNVKYCSERCRKRNHYENKPHPVS
ncbi:MAG: DUF2256 domain-containing protein [Balneolaceae bacterium]|nr:MAG: DUF2256 domain-containing protein [Balneolaceae bacterium]